MVTYFFPPCLFMSASLEDKCFPNRVPGPGLRPGEWVQPQADLTLRLWVTHSRMETRTVEAPRIPNTLIIGNFPSRRHLYPWKSSTQLHSKKPGPYAAQREFSGQFNDRCPVWLQMSFCPSQWRMSPLTSILFHDALPPGQVRLTGRIRLSNWMKPWNSELFSWTMGFSEISIIAAVDASWRSSTWLREQFDRSNPMT